jgi:hypothetical protein
MQFLEFFSLLSAIIGMFFWNRSEQREDIRKIENMLNINRDLLEKINFKGLKW